MIKVKSDVQLSVLKEYGFERVDDKIFSSDMFRGYMKTYSDGEQSITIAVHDRDSTQDERSVNISGHGTRDIQTLVFDAVAEELLRIFQNNIFEEV